ncbi:hypothetical protein DFH06DRAFT_1167938 [Mycena polygramma]|nr:hypothetical protein DFH06DRAFT_1167938 [Mycena polygramma]
MSQRRKAHVCRQPFTIFIMGILAHSFPLVVTKATTIQDIVERLRSFPLVRKTKQDRFYFTHTGRKISWADRLDSLGVGSGSHLFLNLIVPGGGKKRPPSSSPSPTAAKQPKNSQVISDEDEPDDRPMQALNLRRPKAPVKARGGRPSQAGRPQRDDGPPDPEQASSPPPTLHPMPETPKKKIKKNKSRGKKAVKFSPRTARTVTFALSGNVLHGPPSDSDNYDSGSDDSDGNSRRTSKRRKRTARALNRVAHSETKGWKRLGSSHTTEVYKTFEDWHNDYNNHGYEVADNLVEVKLLGHPVDRPKDIRARPFLLQWITPDREAPKDFSEEPRPVFRAIYRCRGNCNDLPPEDRVPAYSSDSLGMSQSVDIISAVSVYRETGRHAAFGPLCSACSMCPESISPPTRQSRDSRD